MCTMTDSTDSSQSSDSSSSDEQSSSDLLKLPNLQENSRL